MAVSERDKRIMAKQAAALNDIELPEDAEITGEARTRRFNAVNAERRKLGLPPLINDEDEIPEIGFHRIAVTRGMVTGNKSHS